MKLSLLLSIALLFGACSTAHLIHAGTTNKLSITMKDRVIVEGEGDPLFKHIINLVNLRVEQSVFELKDGSILTYEYARAATSYQFTHSMIRTVTIVFPSYNARLVNIKDNLHFFELKAKDKSEIEYLILENMNKKGVRMLYGLDTKLFYSIYYGGLTKYNEPAINEIVKAVNVTEQYIKSKWNHKNIILDLIISKVDTSKIRV